MNTYDLIRLAARNVNDGWQDANGYLMPNSSTDVDLEVVPYGYEYPAPLVVVNPPSQVPGLTSGTPDPVTPNQQVFLRPATSLTGNGSGATFGYLTNTEGAIYVIFSDTAGTGYLEGDHISITTTPAHGSQTLSFHLVAGSNRAEVPVTLIHDRPNPLPFAVSQYRVVGTSNKTVMTLTERV